MSGDYDQFLRDTKSWKLAQEARENARCYICPKCGEPQAEKDGKECTPCFIERILREQGA